jgi:hypothetical protein
MSRNLFSDPAAHTHVQPREHLLKRHMHFILIWKLRDHAEGCTARNNRCFVHGSGAFSKDRDKGVPTLHRQLVHENYKEKSIMQLKQLHGVAKN